MQVVIHSKGLKDPVFYMQGEKILFDSDVYDFGRSKIVNKTLSAVVFIAQRDKANSVASLHLDHGPTLEALEKGGEGREWGYLSALLSKVQWAPAPL